MHRGANSFFSYLMLFLFSILPVAGQVTDSFAEKESPVAVFSLDRDDTEVELFVQGGWGIRSVISTGFAIRPAGNGREREVIFPYRYPSFETELLSQEVDLLLSLWLFSQYFFEASFGDDASIRTIAAGYVTNQEDSLVQEAVVGNVPLTIQRYPFMPFGGSEQVQGASPVPGGVLRLATAQTYHELLVQLERSIPQRRRISAAGEMRQLRVPVASFIDDQVFRLPHRRVEQLRVLVEDSTGTVVLRADGKERRFSELAADDSRWAGSSETGEVRLSPRIPRDLAVAVLYTPKNDADGRILTLDEEDRIQDEASPFSLTPDTGATLGNGPLGATIPLNRFRLQRVSPGSGAERGVLLRDPGLYSPFLDGRYYAIPAEAQESVNDGNAVIRIVRRSTEQPIPEEQNFAITPTDEATRLRIDNRRAAEDNAALREQQFPFYQEPFGEGVYGIRRGGEAAAAPFEILLEYTSGTGRVTLEENLVPGSVQVRRDGVFVPGVVIDRATGEVQLPDTLPGEGPFELTYRTYSAGGGTTDVIAVSGNRWSIQDSLFLTLAGGLRWSASSSSYSIVENEHPGELTASLTAEYEDGGFSLVTSVAAQLLQPDTTGFIRLYSGDEQRLRITPSATNLFPAPAPVEDTDFDPQRRGDLLYRDLWQQDIRGRWNASNYRSTAPADDRDREGSRIGPFIATSTDQDFTGSVAVMEWEELPGEQWVGAILRAPEGIGDVRNTRALTVRYRLEYTGVAPPSGISPELVLDLGTLGEDLDGDGRAQRGRSSLDPTFDFVFPDGHPRAGQVRRAGQDVPDLAAPHREDFRAPGTLLEENRDARMRLSPGGAAAIPTGEWIEETILLTPEQAARLSVFRGARLLLRNPTSAGETPLPPGRLVIGAIDLLRSGEALITAGLERGATAVTRPDPLTPALSEQSATVAHRFNRGSGTSQPVLQIQWEPAASVSPVAAEFRIIPFSVQAYDSLVFYYAITEDTVDPGEITVTLEAEPGAAATDRLRITLPADIHRDLPRGWQKVQVNLRTGAVSLPWAETTSPNLPAATLPENRFRPLTIVTVRIPDAPAGGTVLIDEVHGKDPVASTAFAGTTRGEWEGALGDGVLRISQELSGQSAGFQNSSTAASGTTIVGTSAVHSESAAAFTQGDLLIRGVLSYTSTEETDWSSGGHELAIPLNTARSVIVEEQFYRSFSPSQPRWDRSAAVTVSPAQRGSGHYRIEHGNSASATRAEQRWSAVANPPGFANVTLTTRFLGELRDLDTTIEPGTYGEDWARSGQRFIPIDSTLNRTRQERRVRGETTVAVGSFVIAPELGFQTRGITGEFQRSTAGFTARWPATLYTGSGRPIRITPRYSRTYRIEEEGASTSFGEDGKRFVAAIQRDPRVLRTIPLVDLFHIPQTPERLTADEQILGWKYSSRSGVRVTRPFTSQLRDLWVPSDVDLAADRIVRQEQERITDQRIWHAAFGTAAVDLLQRRIAVDPWYQGDELRQRVSLGLDESQPGVIEKWSVAIQQETRLFAISGREVRVRSTATWEQADVTTEEYTVVGTYRWRRNAPPALLGRRQRGENPFFLNRQKVNWTHTREDEKRIETTIELGHSTTLVLPPAGEIQLFADVGISSSGEESSRGRIFLAGLRAGIEGILRY